MVARHTLYQTVKEKLLQEIHQGLFGESGKLPSEKELCLQYDVSRATVRSALQSLEADGIIEIRHGAGSYVRPIGSRILIRLDVFTNFSEMIRRNGYTPSMKTISVHNQQFSEDICKKMHLEKGSAGVIVHRMVFGDGIPVIGVSEYISANVLLDSSLADVFTVAAEKIPSSIVKFSDSFCKERIEYCVTEISAVTHMPAPFDDAFNSEGPGMTLHLEEYSFGRSNHLVVFSDVYVHDTEMVKFQILNRRA